MGRNAEAQPRNAVVSADDSLATAVKSSLSSGLEKLRAQEDGAAVGDVESLHQLRVATRRLRASIDLFGSVLNGNQVRLWKRDLPWVAQAAGQVRERDIIATLIRVRAAKIDPKLAESLGAAYQKLSVERSDRLHNFATVLQSERYQQMINRLAHPVLRKGAEEQKLARSAADILRPIASGAARAGEHLAADAPPGAVHRARVRVKRLRYGLELLAEFGGKRKRKALALLEELQDQLGEFNDVIVTGGWLIEYGASADAPSATALAAGALVQSLGKRQQKLAGRCLKTWRKYERSAIMRDTLGEIRRGGQIEEHASPASSDAA
ncbi:MAG TPA: CHAD domain-containing protein [Candidatus Binataceae bacterium]|nr:CHAD domain-containing protein [Candidatus Binataceae bacterium]